MAYGISGDNPSVINGLNTANLSLIELRVISNYLAVLAAGGTDTQQIARNDEALALAQQIPVPSA